ncbi:class I SAM-dependent methyltransferase [Hydrogenophaga taeniospiralis]|uniref:class I SAM-dependent methyltransferase n=1 Tax=Hydrogenophaga taeniospiralis TaxID=65656 RepID=UPI001CFAF86E|nr:class I SAM-dependent methyltransferase [Hydrogenophaga taeniospiralis]MCB4362596.1 class I SAM-dependent methyltransferase [Hydrogenophaga taeniospiralis]
MSFSHQRGNEIDDVSLWRFSGLQLLLVMSRILSKPDDDDLPRIDRAKVGEFFAERARRIDRIGPVRAVIYQDKHADLAERRDAAEKACLTPLLRLGGVERLLDVGCGTGRWARELLGHCAAYHGMDFSRELIAYAKSHLGESADCRFTVAAVDNFTLNSLHESLPFDRILCAGVLIYLNDDELLSALRNIAGVMAPKSRAVFREPMAVSQRLTIKDHFSDELEQAYNAIYRTEEQIRSLIVEAMSSSGCRSLDSGDVYADESMNNRAETRQRWLVVERCA